MMKQATLQYSPGRRLVTANRKLADVFGEVRRVLAPSGSSVLILGETGVGKEGIARALHHYSDRRNGPFVAVNCATIMESLAEAELFGHEKGAFTGAGAKKKGHFEEANGGTIFLDEVGELSPDNQARLLRVLQEGEIIRVGGGKPVKINVRVVAATKQTIPDLVSEGRFRDDLYYRLAAEIVRMPSLRARPEDVKLLAETFVKEKAEAYEFDVPLLDSRIKSAFRRHSWPGNVRELQNTISAAMNRYRFRPDANGRLLLRDLPSMFSVQSTPDTSTESDAYIEPYDIKGLEQAILSQLDYRSPRRISDLSAHFDREKTAIHRRLKLMEKRGLVAIERRRGRGGNLVHLRAGK